MRVLHCPAIVGGNPTGLAAAERELGLDSRAVALEQTRWRYRVDEVVWKDRDGPLVRELKRWRLLLRALREFDVVHFNFGSSIAPQRLPAADGPQSTARTVVRSAYGAYAALLEQRDLPLLARSGKAIFVTFQGDDARQGDFCRRFPVNAAVEASPGYYTPESDANKRRRIARFARYADGIYALNPDLLHVLPARARFEPYAHVDVRDWDPGPPAGAGERPLVLHAPTDRAIKGTRFLLAAVERLRDEGVQFDFQLVEGLPHDQAKALYRRADVLVDQLLVGWYGGLAVELMALERPVVAYLRQEDLRFLPSGMRRELPVISADPGSIVDVLRDLLSTRRPELAGLGRRGRDYVDRWHNPRLIAERLEKDYADALATR
jgi:hypothetical protein